jgi:hypothetical protein
LSTREGGGVSTGKVSVERREEEFVLNEKVVCREEGSEIRSQWREGGEVKKRSGGELSHDELNHPTTQKPKTKHDMQEINSRAANEDTLRLGPSVYRVRVWRDGKGDTP